MLAVYCDEVNARVLLGLDSISRIQNGDDEVRVSYRCQCGRHGVMATGKGRHGETSGHIGI